MSYTIQQLFNDRENSIPPTGIEQHASVQEALNIMLKKQYSQLPIVDQDNRLVGEHTAYMVTNESILQALSHLNVAPKVLRVYDVMVRIRPYRLEDQLSDLLKDLRDTYAVPIMGEKRRLVGVVTSYDTTEYFRKRAEDMMHIEQIEKNLKLYITAYFSDPDGEIDHASRDAAIEENAPSNKKLRGPFKKALQHYLELQGESEAQVVDKLAQQAFDKHLYRKEIESFDKLSFDDYIRLFVHEGRWKRYKHIFSIDGEAMGTLLRGVRDIRNDLAHFRIETITDEQRRKIEFCNDWLEKFYDAVMEEFQQGITTQKSYFTTDVIESITVPPVVSSTLTDNPSMEVLPLEEEKPSYSRYAPLATWLQEQPPGEQAVQLTFQQIEAIIGDALPTSARRSRSWWANDSVGHVQSQQWLDVGWRVSHVNMQEETVIFVRAREREYMYKDFFNALHSDLSRVASFSLRSSPVGGRNWMTVSQLPGPTFLGFAFTHRKRFRVELYIGAGKREENKQMFDALLNDRHNIEAMFGNVDESLEWERLDDRQASRVALYHKGSIEDSAEDLTNLRVWAVDAMIRFQKVMEKYVSELV